MHFRKSDGDFGPHAALGRSRESQEEKVEYKVFVGGISWQMEDADLMDAFAKYNPTGAQVMKVRLLGLCLLTNYDSRPCLRAGIILN
jgi:hypothetical protein